MGKFPFNIHAYLSTEATCLNLGLHVPSLLETAISIKPHVLAKLFLLDTL